MFLLHYFKRYAPLWENETLLKWGKPTLQAEQRSSCEDKALVLTFVSFKGNKWILVIPPSCLEMLVPQFLLFPCYLDPIRRKTAGSTFPSPRCSASPPCWFCSQRSPSPGFLQGSFPRGGPTGWTISSPWWSSCAREGEAEAGARGLLPVPLAPDPLLPQADGGCWMRPHRSGWELELLPAPQPQHSRGGCDAEVHIDAQPQPGVRDECQRQLGNFDGVDLVPAGAEMKVSGDQHRLMCNPWLLLWWANPKSP